VVAGKRGAGRSKEEVEVLLETWDDKIPKERDDGNSTERHRRLMEFEEERGTVD